MKTKNKRKIMIVSGIGIAIAAVAIGVAAAISNPGSEKNSIQAVSGQTTESKENDMELPVLPIGTDGKSDSKEQTESTVERMIRNRLTQRIHPVQTAKCRQIKSLHIRTVRNHRILKRIQQDRRIRQRIQTVIKAMMTMAKIPVQGQIRQRITTKNRKVRKIVNQINRIPTRKVRIR